MTYVDNDFNFNVENVCGICTNPFSSHIHSHLMNKMILDCPGKDAFCRICILKYQLELEKKGKPSEKCAVCTGNWTNWTCSDNVFPDYDIDFNLQATDSYFKDSLDKREMKVIP